MFETRDFKNPALFDCARPFREAAIRHPLHDQSSEEYQLMIRASRMLKAIREGGQRNIDPSTHEASIQSSIAPVDRVPDHARYISDDKFSKLFRYIRDMLELDCVGLSGLQNPLKLQVEVANNMDTMFPFRELAPGRIQSRSNEGPYSPEHCATRAGLFSALVWRGITFSTKFSMQEPMLFNSYSEWEDTLSKVRESGEEESYIYNISAYGVTNSNRGPQHATKYWTASKSHDWALYSSDGPVEFMPCYEEFFYTGESPTCFPQIGQLTGYLITADYVYTGLVQMLTLDEIGTLQATRNY